MNRNETPPEKKPRRSLFARFFAKDGKGVDKSDAIKLDEYSAKNFFKIYLLRFNTIVKTNWLYIFGNFPIFAILLVISGYLSHTAVAPASQFYPIVYGIETISGASPMISPMLGIHAVMSTARAYSWLDYVMFGVGALTLITFGIVNTGCAYVMKNLVRGEYIILWQDFKGAVKQNLRQGIVIGIIDAVILGLSAYSVSFYLSNYSTYYILFFASVAMLIIYMFIRYYMYTLLVTFELTIPKIIKNAFIFAMIGLGKNFLALIITVALIGVVFLLSTLFIPIGIILTLMLLIATCTYVSTYLTYPKIKKVMIDPYYPDYGKEPSDEVDEQ